MRTSFVCLLASCVSCLRLPADIDNWVQIKKKTHRTTIPNFLDEQAIDEIYQKYPYILQYASSDKGRRALDDMMKEEARLLTRHYVVMEIGVFLGMSAARWLNVHPNIAVVGVDPFSYPRSTSKEVASIPNNLQGFFDHDGFCQRLTEHVIRQQSPESEDRWGLVKGFSPTAAMSALKVGTVDAFYLDGGKIRNTTQFTLYINESLRTFHAHNSDALISGDDWSHKRTPTLQNSLRSFAAEKGLQLIRSDDQTWMMGKNVGRHRALQKHDFIWEVEDPEKYMGPTFSEIIESTKIGSESIMTPE